MTAYLIATVRKVTDRRGLEAYWASVMPSFAGTGLKPLAVYTNFKKVEGDYPLEAVILMEFPDMATAQRWYDSPAYQSARQHRLGAADAEIIFVDGGIVPDEQRLPNFK
jgi:uncharacterized protein (DUF1330 family)